MPHVPLGVSDKFRGKSAQGLYGDVIIEIDWSVGQILDALQRLKLEENTLVLFMTDNGPWVSYGNHAGSASPLREAKGTTFEGGVRVPCIARWSGRIPAGRVCHEPAMTIDILPTLAGLVEAKLPAHTIDGLDIRDIMLAKRGAKSPHEALCFYWGQELQAVRSGQWKLHFPHTYRTLNARESGKDGIPAKYENDQIGLALYNLQADPGERQNLADQQPAIAERLVKTAKAFDAELQKSKREPGRV
jgi:arylsulfatase A-like enzyme